MVPRPNASSFYRPITTAESTQGSVYRFVPVVWLVPPIEIIREAEGDVPRIGRESSWDLPFNLAATQGEESVVARAKKRTIVILSPDVQNQRPGIPGVLVVPIYSMDTKKAELQERIKRDSFRNYWYLPPAKGFLDRDFAADFRHIAEVNKQFLTHKVFELSEDALKHLLSKLALYFGIERISGGATQRRK